jgi:activator of Hsp90 ATPase-like protein
MDQHDFTTSFLVDQTPAEVFKAVTNVRGWWSVGIEGDTEKLNDEFIYQVEGVHYSKMKLIDVVPDERVVWLVKYNYLSFVKDKSEWTGTKVHFDISRQGDKTQLRFTHEGLVPEYECYEVCTPAWTNYVQGSLLPLITTGQGHPNQETV